jgi:hypothetical protein
MSLRALVCAVAGIMLGMSQAGAVTYNYLGNPDDGLYGGTVGNYMTATVDVACVGICDGEYNKPAGNGGPLTSSSSLISYSMTVHNSAGNEIISRSSGDGNITSYDGSYIVFDNGVVTHWELFLYDLSTYASYQSSGHGYYNSDGDYQGQAGLVSLNHPGVWTLAAAATPLPAALPLFASGLGALGVIGWRRKRKAQAAA